ncbi:MAG: glycosyltransferase family 4 protein [Planctomycetaceae bacterium]|nr:glycosyltransferase family 4 protein [Planctomycetaceae bacterium]
MSADRCHRILICFEYTTLNGGEHSLLAALRLLKRKDLQFITAAPPEGRLFEALQALNLPIYPLQLRDKSGRKRSSEEINTELRSLIEQVQPDLVHANSLAMGRHLGRIAGDIHQPLTAHLRDIIRLSDQAIEDLNQLDRLIAVSDATAYYHEKQGLSANKIIALNNGVDTELFQPRPPIGKLKFELGLKPESFLIANIGQICLRKGQNVVAEAVSRLIESFPELHLLFVGERYSQKQESIDYEKRLHQVFDEAGHAEHVHFLGYREDIPFILNEVDLLVHTAHQEPFGRVLLEAAASGCPIVATTVGGTISIIEPNYSGMLLPPGDPDLLEYALQELIPDAQRRNEFSEAARESVAGRYSISYSAAGLYDIWKELL